MAYAVDWIAKVISIPTSDLTLVSGTRYSLQMSDFLGEIRRLEAGFGDGLWAPEILDHTNPKLDFAGVDYAGFDELINGYTVQVTGVATRVDLLGSNNNLVDVLIATGVSIVPSNSAGLQLVSTGSGLSTAQDTKLTEIHGEVDSIEGGFGLAQWIRLISAALTGRMTGQGTGTIHARDMANTKDRLVVPYTDDGRGQPTTRDPD